MKQLIACYQHLQFGRRVEMKMCTNNSSIATNDSIQRIRPQRKSYVVCLIFHNGLTFLQFSAFLMQIVTKSFFGQASDLLFTWFY